MPDSFSKIDLSVGLLVLRIAWQLSGSFDFKRRLSS